MPSDEALRVSLVCTLPLLHFSHSRVAVVQPSAVSKIFNPADDCPLAVPPPPFRLHARSRKCLARSELPLRTHSFRSFFRGFLRPRLPFWTSSGLWAVLSFDSNRLSFSRSSHCACGFSSSCEAYSKSAARVTSDSHSWTVECEHSPPSSTSGVTAFVVDTSPRRRLSLW